MGIDIFVVRDAEAGVPAFVAEHGGPGISVLSAGEAHLSHPTQGLLDALTILRHKPRLDGLAITIVGDIRHSRVARSAVQALALLVPGKYGWWRRLDSCRRRTNSHPAGATRISMPRSTAPTS